MTNQLTANEFRPEWLPGATTVATIGHGLNVAVEQIEAIASHARRAGMGQVDLHNELHRELIEFSENILENKDSVTEEMKPAALLRYAQARIAVAQLVITDESYHRTAQNLQDLANYGLIFAPYQPLGINQKLIDIIERANAVEVETEVYPALEDYSNAIITGLVSNGEEVCQHLENGYPVEEMDPDAPMNRMHDMIERISDQISGSMAQPSDPFNPFGDGFASLWEADDDEDDPFDA